MIARLILALFAAFALAACGGDAGAGEAGERQREEREQPPSPALWELASADGEVEGWLFGTIHALPAGFDWRTDRLERVVERADLLVVEVASLEDSEAISHVFMELAHSPDQPPLAERVTPALRDELTQVIEAGEVDRRLLGGLETWAAALALARTEGDGGRGPGADIALIRDFAGRPVRELEGARSQLALFDALPEREQRAMLEAVVTGLADSERDFAALARDWRAGRVEALVGEAQAGLLADPGLRAVLLDDRNRDWAARLDMLLRRPARPLIAVGAAHLGGPDGLPALLERRGYAVTRIQ